MDHEEAVWRLPELHARQLEPRAARQLEHHLEGCAECREMAEAYAAVHVALAGGPEAADHPTVEHLVAHALAPEARTGPETDALAEHLRACAQCRDELERTRRVHAGVVAANRTRPDGARRWPTATRMVAVAASILLVLVALDAIRLRRSIQTAAPGWSGPVELKVLTSGTRGEAPAQTVAVAHGQSHVLLALEIDNVARLGDTAELHLEIFDGDDRIVWAHRLEAGQAKRSMAETGVVTLLVPGDRLPDGSYAARASPASEGAAPLATIRFSIRRE